MHCLQRHPLLSPWTLCRQTAACFNSRCTPWPVEAMTASEQDYKLYTGAPLLHKACCIVHCAASAPRAVLNLYDCVCCHNPSTADKNSASTVCAATPSTARSELQSRRRAVAVLSAALVPQWVLGGQQGH
jgi:hypothetical protein